MFPQILQDMISYTERFCQTIYSQEINLKILPRVSLKVPPDIPPRIAQDLSGSFIFIRNSFLIQVMLLEVLKRFSQSFVQKLLQILFLGVFHEIFKKKSFMNINEKFSSSSGYPFKDYFSKMVSRSLKNVSWIYFVSTGFPSEISSGFQPFRNYINFFF